MKIVPRSKTFLDHLKESDWYKKGKITYLIINGDIVIYLERGFFSTAKFICYIQPKFNILVDSESKEEFNYYIKPIITATEKYFLEVEKVKIEYTVEM